MKRRVKRLGKPIAASTVERALERKGRLLFGPQVPLDFVDNGCSVPAPRFLGKRIHTRLKRMADGWWRWA